MKKLILIFLLLFSVFSLAQKSEIRRTFHFDLELEFSHYEETPIFPKYKFINTTNDDIEGVGVNINLISVHDFKKRYVHIFRKINNETSEYIYEVSHKNPSRKNYVEIKKLDENKYQLKRFNLNDKPTQILILNLEDFQYNAANSLHLHDNLFLDSNYLKKLRRKEKDRNFIIKSYQTSYDGKKINYESIVKTEKIDITLTLPKKLKFYHSKNPRENL